MLVSIFITEIVKSAGVAVLPLSFVIAFLIVMVPVLFDFLSSQLSGSPMGIDVIGGSFPNNPSSTISEYPLFVVSLSFTIISMYRGFEHDV